MSGGRGHRVEYIQNPVQPGDLDEVGKPRSRHNQPDVPPSAPDTLGRAHENPQSGGIDEIHAGEIYHHVLPTGTDHRSQPLPEPGGGGHINLTGNGQDLPLGARSNYYPEFHEKLD